MAVKVLQVDAFSQTPFSGNPAAVCLLSGPGEEHWMQQVAAEMNLAATAFVEPRDDGFGLRWFTSRVELTLCGHGTLAAAHVLWEDGSFGAGDGINFHTVAGILTAQRESPWINLGFPAEPERPDPKVPEGLPRALGVPAVYVGKNRLDYLVEVESEEVLTSLAPDLALLARLPARGVIVTAPGSGEYDFVSRYFAPAIGIDEDQATGSAHCCLGPFWGPRIGKDEMLAYQASPRGGVIRVRLEGDRVRLGGMAVTILRGELA
ncbi:MAG TPA: PhzF family phenazine biosynthesis protein [Actinomycetota bacterium]|jgi:PhzF family phenazine biosynthesis protein|nr:PhzF family phenazine biosynthesis protein [Actinomycetota bacterium]